MKSPRSVVVSALLGGLAIHLVMIACTSSHSNVDDDGVGASHSTASMDAASSASAQTPSDCAQWQVRVDFSALNNGGADWDAPPGWEPFAADGYSVHLRRCVD